MLPREVRPNGIIVGVHQVVRDRDGNLLSDSRLAHAYTFRGELILTMTIYPSLDAARQ